MDFDTLSKDELISLLKQAAITIERLGAQVTALQAEVEALKEVIERLQGGPPSKPKPSVPAFVKPNAKPRPKTPRKKRPHGFARKRQEPTVTVPHFPDSCSCCGRKLTGGWQHRVREVIELPSEPVQVIHHQIMARHCGVCDRTEVASPDLSGSVVGKSRLGLRLMSTIAYLDTTCRMPVRTIRDLLGGLYGLSLSIGEITGVLHTVAERGKASYQALLSEMRASPVVHADETGWRQNGKNGFVWSFSTPSLRLYTGHRGRSGEVAKEMLGSSFDAALVTDFYGGYRWYHGLHQYCWVHLLRDVRKLREEHTDDVGVNAFTSGVKQIYEAAKSYTHPNRYVRGRKRREFQAEICALARQHIAEGSPQRTLATRILNYEWGLFVFVEYPDVPSENNAAERAIRPLVVVRKVSGGTRSEAGSDTLAILLSLFGTWQIRGMDLLNQCQQVISGRPEPQPG